MNPVVNRIIHLAFGVTILERSFKIIGKILDFFMGEKYGE